MQYRSFGKRALDLLLTFLWLPVLVVLHFMVLLLYAITGTSQPFFQQERIGMNGKIFTLFKFRTLTNHMDRDLVDRQFALGKFLRATSLDELPQFVNVIMGHMSIVGPRPLPVEYATLFSSVQNKRHQVRPGITGWTQVNGRTTLAWPQKFELDIFYVENMSLKLDVKIMLRTVRLLVTLKGDNSLAEKKFEKTNE